MFQKFRLIFALLLLGTIIGILFSRNTSVMDNYKRHRAKCPKNATVTNDSILVADSARGLGNVMFTYAALYAIGLDNNCCPFMAPRLSTKLSKYFKVSLPTLNETLYNSVNWTDLEPSRDFLNLSMRVTTNPDLRFIKLYNEFTYSWRYFDHCRRLIRNEFQFHDYIVLRSKLKIEKAIRDIENGSEAGAGMTATATTVGVHVRRTDYIKYSKRTRLELPTIKFYMESMRYMEKKYGPHVIFIFVSDDIPWCVSAFSNHSIQSELSIKFLNGTSSSNGGFDLAVLSLCDHVIFGVGTFGFWGGYLSHGEAIYCSDCATSKSRWTKLLLDYSNFVLPSWTGFTRDGKASQILAKWWKIPEWYPNGSAKTTRNKSQRNAFLFKPAFIVHLVGLLILHHV